MATITLKGNAISTCGEIPSVGETCPSFSLVASDLSESTLETYAGKKKILNIFPSIDTGICALSVKAFYEKAGAMKDVVVLNISADLPFAQKRFCGAEGIENALSLSSFRSAFAKDFNLEIVDGPLKGLCSRVVLVLDEQNKILYSEQVSEIAQEPNYAQALATI